MGFNPFTITTQGAILASKTLIGKELKFTKFKVGDGNVPDDIKSLEELVNPIMPVAITSILRTTPIQVTVKALLKNTDAPQNFYWKELGLYAQDPDTKEEVLFAYAHYGENPEYIVNSISQPIDRYIQQIITVDNADNVEIEINPDTVYVTHQELELEINKLKKKDEKIYGVKRNIESSDPAWERIGDSVGLVANATHDGTEVQNDFDNIYPYSDIISYNYDTQAQRITAYYGEPTFKFDGSNGEVMTRIPEFWYKREQKTESDGNTYEYVYIADYPAEGFIKSEQFSVGRYITSSDSNNNIHSSNGGNIHSDTISNVKNSVKALGEGFCLMDWHYFIIQLLYLVEYANYNSQAMLGMGLSSISVVRGQCDVLGMKSGTPDDWHTSMIYRGIEDIYGATTTLIDGINVTSEGIFISYNNNLSESDNKLSNILLNTLRGYAKKIGYDENNPIVQLPIEEGGDTSTYICDASLISFPQDENRVICSNYINTPEMVGLWSFRIAGPAETIKPATRLLLNK